MPTAPLPDDLQRILDDHRETLNDLQGHLELEPPPPVIYHYTDDKGLKGILENGCLWLTDIRSLNDPSELSHGLTMAADIIEKAAANGPAPYRTFAEMFGNAMRRRHGEIAHNFVCCFSKTGDELGQWRAYANDGHGFAIGFNTNLLETGFKQSCDATAGAWSTFPVIYDDDRLHTVLKRFIDVTLPCLSALSQEHLAQDSVKPFIVRLSVELAKACFFASMLKKHSGYLNEDEYRFFRIYRSDSDVPNLRIRSRPYSIVRYVEFEWKEHAFSSVVEIIAGPSTDYEMSRRFVLDCFREYMTDCKPPLIKKSTIPYRNLRSR